MISLKECSKPPIKKIKFICDVPIHSKLDNFELTKNFMNRPNTTAFIGRQGSGKTSLLINFVNSIMRKCFHKIYVFMRETSRNSLDNNIFDKYLPTEQLYEDVSVDSLEEVYEQIKANAMNGEYTLCIFDDVQDALKDTQILKVLKKFVANQRHLRLVNFILLQNYNALDKKLRCLLNNMIIFKLDKTQTETIFEECIESGKKHYEKINSFVYDEPYNWLFINLPQQKLYKMWDEIVVS